MDAETEKLCLEEIDHLVLDQDKKITLTYISNTWNVPNKVGEVVLEKWLKRNSDQLRIVKEYLIRGIDKNGNSIITIVAEKNLPKVDKACPNNTKILYSVEIGSKNGKSLNILEPTPNKYISLKIETGTRDIKVSKIAIPAPEKSTKKEPETKKNNFFGAGSSKAPQSKSEKKTETNASDSAKPVVVEQKKTSPKKQSPKKNQSTSKQPQGKSSIASFFASKPTTSNGSVKSDKSVLEAASKIQSVKIKDEPAEAAPSESKASQKRPLSSDSSFDTKSTEKKVTQTKKKMKLEKQSARARLMKICDSSSDEEEPRKVDVPMDTEDEVVVKKEKENKTPSPNKTNGNAPKGSSSGKRRAKVKRTVTRTYEDDDGFINTVHETEEVSVSEDEPEEVAPPPPKKPTPTSASNSTAPKKKISPTSGDKKQGSILSFFGKK